MKRTLAIALSAAAMLGTASIATAQSGATPDVVDMSTLTCGTLLSMDQTKIGFAIIWGMGYVDAGAGKAALDMNSLQTVAMNVGMVCGAESGTLVLDAVKRATTM